MCALASIALETPYNFLICGPAPAFKVQSIFIRSTLLSRPNKVSLKRSYVRPQNVSSITMKFGL